MDFTKFKYFQLMSICTFFRKRHLPYWLYKLIYLGAFRIPIYRKLIYYIVKNIDKKSKNMYSKYKEII